MFTAFLDTNILFPIITTDIALRCAQRGMLSVAWSGRVLEELHTVLIRELKLPEGRVKWRISQMREAFP